MCAGSSHHARRCCRGAAPTPPCRLCRHKHHQRCCHPYRVSTQVARRQSAGPPLHGRAQGMGAAGGAWGTAGRQAGRRRCIQTLPPTPPRRRVPSPLRPSSHCHPCQAHLQHVPRFFQYARRTACGAAQHQAVAPPALAPPRRQVGRCRDRKAEHKVLELVGSQPRVRQGVGAIRSHVYGPEGWRQRRWQSPRSAARGRRVQQAFPSLTHLSARSS